MNIYVAHSREFDFQSELYLPIRQSNLNHLHTFVLPHEKSSDPFDSKTFFQQDCNLLIAEVSFPSIGLGIELGWANIYSVPILSIYQSGAKVSNSVKGISNQLLEYTDADDLLHVLNNSVNEFISNKQQI